MGKIDDTELALALVASGGNRTKTADALGISRRTVQNRLQVPEFQAVLAEAEKQRDAMLKSLGDAAAVKAVRFIHEVLDADSSDVFCPYSPRDKFRAASMALGLWEKGLEAGER